MFRLSLNKNPRHRAGIVSFHIKSLIITAALVLTLGPGCKSAHQTSETKTEGGSPPSFQTRTRIYIATPPDAIFKDQTVARSSKHTKEALGDAFRLFTKLTFTGKTQETLNEALEHAQKSRAEFLIFPVILTWEDHLTEWTTVRDRLDIRLEIYDVKTGNRIYSSEIKARGGWMSDGDDTPEMLLQKPCEQFVRSIYHEVVQPSAFP